MADRAKRSKVWAHFTKLNETTAKCSICNTTVACKGGNTSNLMKHLLVRHSIELKKRAAFDRFCKAAADPADPVQPPGSDADGTVSTTSRQGVGASPAGRRRRRQAVEVEDFFERMQRMQNSWMAAQWQQSQDREERLVTRMLESNARMVSALTECVRGCSPYPAASAPPTPPPPRPPGRARHRSAQSTAAAKPKTEGYLGEESVGNDSADLSSRPLKEEEIVVDVTDGTSAQSVDTNDSVAAPTPVSHVEAAGCFRRGLDWLKQQPEADLTQILIIRSLIAIAEKKSLIGTVPHQSSS